MRSLRPVVASLLLLLVLAPAAQAAATRDAKQMLINVRTLERAAKANSDEIAAAIERFTTRTKSCAENIGQDTESAQEAFALIFVLDFGQVYSAPIRKEVRLTAGRFTSMPIRDTRIKALARLLGRQGKALAALPEMDTCALLEQWRGTGFSKETMPQVVRDGLAGIYPKGADQTLVRGRARLIKRGLTKAQATRVVDFPLV